MKLTLDLEGDLGAGASLTAMYEAAFIYITNPKAVSELTLVVFFIYSPFLNNICQDPQDANSSYVTERHKECSTYAITLPKVTGNNGEIPPFDSCNAHVEQWYRNKGQGQNDLRFHIEVTDVELRMFFKEQDWTIKDGEVKNLGNGTSMLLPYYLLFTAGFGGTDFFQFAYTGYEFSSAKGCDITEKVDHRVADCRFKCKFQENPQ
ncbi:hypothetical protein F5B22DRAFT_661804 [Xylaria bambusicola]|uniref:uncharacterized protein n=1 Tax=Xylaria bambusicola TaxID=326684 RepID=UPI0020075235|nr:uncharacterized protein F5B22DRAFT_661804 [Xylaria bambusicola]KAI0505157.1 hypothetical protein F5B22DRAFT_661804 [Xylaria bambusicola]